MTVRFGDVGSGTAARAMLVARPGWRPRAAPPARRPPSTTRKLTGIGFPGARFSDRLLLADLHLNWDSDRADTTRWIHRDGMVGVMPMPSDDRRDNLWRIIAYDPGQDTKPTDEEILARIRTLLPERTGHSAVGFPGPVWLSLFTVPRLALPRGPDPDRRRRRAHARAVRRPGHAHGAGRRGEPRPKAGLGRVGCSQGATARPGRALSRTRA